MGNLFDIVSDFWANQIIITNLANNWLLLLEIRVKSSSIIINWSRNLSGFHLFFINTNNMKLILSNKINNENNPTKREGEGKGRKKEGRGQERQCLEISPVSQFPEMSILLRLTEAFETTFWKSKLTCLARNDVHVKIVCMFFIQSFLITKCNM